MCQNQPKAHGDGRQMADYGEVLNVDIENWIALQAVHGAIGRALKGHKYQWFGSGYISNMYFKEIALKPTYGVVGGRDISESRPAPVAVGDKDGKPFKRGGW